MIKRGSGVCKVVIAVSLIVIVTFLALVTMTNLFDIVKVEWCLAALILSCTVLPFLIEAILYGFGKATKQIRTQKRNAVFVFEPADEHKAYIETIADGSVQCLFFLPNGKIVLSPKSSTEFVNVADNTRRENKICIEKTTCVCKGLFAKLYDTENVIKYTVFTTIEQSVKPNVQATEEGKNISPVESYGEDIASFVN